MNVGLTMRPVARPDLLHQRQAEALRRAALDLADHGLRVERTADVLRRADPDDSRQAEILVHLCHDAHGADREGDMRALAQ